MNTGNKVIWTGGNGHIYLLVFYLVYTIGSITSVEINIYIGMSPAKFAEQRRQEGIGGSNRAVNI